MDSTVYTLEEIRSLINECKEELENNYNAVNFFVFGSYSRGEQTSESDIDLLVEFKTPIGLKFLKLEKHLEKLFLKKVDLATVEGLKPSIKNTVLAEAIKLWLIKTEIIDYTNRFTYQELVKDTRTLEAVELNLIVIGEASKYIPDEIKEKLSNIPFNEISGLRNRLAHDYLGIDLKIIWEIIQTDLPGLKKILEKSLIEL